MELGLDGKVVFVAAASKGLGRAIAEEFAREGAKVVMCSREEANITAAAREIAKATGLSLAACSRFRAGTRVPHPRHWKAFSALVDEGAS